MKTILPALIFALLAVLQARANAGDLPLEEARAVRLPAPVNNDLKESWSRDDARTLHWWVRNVTQPTLAIFPPAPSLIDHAAIIIVPGGGFMTLDMAEGYRVAHWLSGRGVTAFVLKPRLVPLPADPERSRQIIDGQLRENGMRIAQRLPLAQILSSAQNQALSDQTEDARSALRYVRAHARELNFSPACVGIIGFSSGAMTAANLASGPQPSDHADFLVLMYGGLLDQQSLRTKLPSAFVAAANDDPVSRYSLDIYQALATRGAEVELHIFADGGHGFGIEPQGKRSDDWLVLLDHWLSTRACLSKGAPSPKTGSGPTHQPR
jgi:acetyl esterase/lipase